MNDSKDEADLGAFGSGAGEDLEQYGIPAIHDLQVMIVDDDPDIRELVKSVVEYLRAEVQVCAGGSEAIAAMRSQLPDVLVLDIMMPDCDGFQVLAALRQCEGGALVPALLLTALDSLDNKIDGLERGADDYLTKPFHIRELRARLRAALRVRALYLALEKKEQELRRAQQELVARERQLLANQLAGTTAHRMRQPLAAMLMQIHLLQGQAEIPEGAEKILGSLRGDLDRLKAMIDQLQTIDANKTLDYHSENEILALTESEGEGATDKEGN